MHSDIYGELWVNIMHVDYRAALWTPKAFIGPGFIPGAGQLWFCSFFQFFSFYTFSNKNSY